MGKTKIEWADFTWNPWMGCTKVSPACDHCYAEELMDTRYGRVQWGQGKPRVRTSAQVWNAPFKWDRKAKAAGRIDTAFCLSLGDFWDTEVNPDWRIQALDVMEQTPNLLYLILSKRIGNARKLVGRNGRRLPPNVALGATMVNQAEWDRDMRKLREATVELGARFCFASVEPMLGSIEAAGDLPDWVIVGGESGRGARPMHPAWVRHMRDQCVAAGVPFFFKQWGEWATVHDADGSVRSEGAGAIGTEWTGDRWCYFRVGKKHTGRLLDGREWNDKPDDRAAGV